MACLLWAGEGTATLALLDGEKVELVSTRAFAPGSRPEASLESTQERVWLKVHNSRRQEDGLYRVTGRLLNATKQLRARLEEAVLNSPDQC
jgi:hypothetical protein